MKTSHRLLEELKDLISTEAGVCSIYDSLMQRDLARHNPNSLNVAEHSTEIMVQLRSLAPDVVRQQIEEQLEEHLITFVPVEFAGEVIKKFAFREANAQTHLFLEMCWKKKRFAWDGGIQKWGLVQTSNQSTKGWTSMGRRVDLGFLLNSLANIDGRASKAKDCRWL